MEALAGVREAVYEMPALSELHVGCFACSYEYHSLLLKYNDKTGVAINSA